MAGPAAVVVVLPWPFVVFFLNTWELPRFNEVVVVLPWPFVVFCLVPNAPLTYRGRLRNRHAARNRIAAPVRSSAWFGVCT